MISTLARRRRAVTLAMLAASVATITPLQARTQTASPPAVPAPRSEAAQGPCGHGGRQREAIEPHLHRPYRRPMIAAPVP